MRKIVIEFASDARIRKVQGNMFEFIESIELLELLRLDFQKGIKLGLMLITIKEGYVLEDVELPDNIEIANVLKSEGSKYTCIVKVKVPKEFRKMMRDFNLDLIWTTPSFMSEDRSIVSCIGEEEDLRKFLDMIKNLGPIKSLSFKKAAYQEHGILSVLTEKQREIVIAAKKNGYSDMPRNISSEQLSKLVGVSKATLLEHLRKAEVRLMDNILAGY
ncbi:MAG: helix-turn-helix domain-containing protein [Thermoplasmata archaeon]